MDIFNYICNNFCPICETTINLECFKTHGWDFFNNFLKEDCFFQKKDIFTYYVFEKDDSCPICEKTIGFGCFIAHASDFYDYIKEKDIPFYCSVCKEVCETSDNLNFHYHGKEDICIWCRKSWNELNIAPENPKHLILCCRDFIVKNALPPTIPNTDEHYFGEDKEKKKCPMCQLSLVSYSNITLKNCKHDFHMSCLANLILNYHLPSCPVCFDNIFFEDIHNLEMFGFTMEKQGLVNFLFECLSNVPIEYRDFYFEELSKFYYDGSQIPIYISKDFTLYPEWTIEKFVRKFVNLTKTSSTKQETIAYFDMFILSNNRTRKIDIEMLEMYNSCPICLNEFSTGDEVVVLPCNHFFDQNCIFQWFNHLKFRPVSKICPLCKQDVV